MGGFLFFGDERDETSSEKYKHPELNRRFQRTGLRRQVIEKPSFETSKLCSYFQVVASPSHCKCEMFVIIRTYIHTNLTDCLRILLNNRFVKHR